MLAIKLKRIGKKKQVAFRLIVAPKRSKLGGKFVEDVGWFNPRTDEFKINKERVLYWIGSGAQPTNTVHNVLIRSHVLKGKKIAVHSISKKKAEVATA